MPIAIAKLGRERTLATLARRVYRIEGEGSAERQRRAEAALLAANPRLATAAGFRHGAAVVVPPVAGLEHTADVAAAATGDRPLTGATALRLQALESRVEDGFRRAETHRKESLERLSDSRFVAEARKALPESVEVIAKAREHLARDEEQAAAAEQRLRGAIESALEGLEKLDALGRRVLPR